MSAPFLMRDIKGVDPEGREEGGRNERSRGRGNPHQDKLYEKKLFSMRGRKEHLSPSERARSKLLSCLQAVQCVPGFQLRELSHTLG